MFKGFWNTWTQLYPPKPTFTESNVPPGSQTGRVFIVTGGNNGIGFELCKILYGSGATVYVACRSQAKAEEAIKAITDSATSAADTAGKLKFLHLDLGDLVVVKKAAESFAAQEPKLDVLWNNAGMGPNRLEVGAKTAQGLEPMAGMHCVATLLFTTLLVPQLRAAAADGGKARTRVVWTASSAVEMSPANGIDLDELDKGGSSDRGQNYGQSKAATWFLGREFARRYGEDGIVSVAQNPGQLNTNSWDGIAPWFIWVLQKVMLQDPVYGAYTELYSGLSDDIGLESNGCYVIPWGRIRPDEAVPRQDLIAAIKTREEGGLGYGEKIWSWCEEKWREFD